MYAGVPSGRRRHHVAEHHSVLPFRTFASSPTPTPKTSAADVQAAQAPESSSSEELGDDVKASSGTATVAATSTERNKTEESAAAAAAAPIPYREYAIVTLSTGVLALGIGAVVPVLPLFVRDAAITSVEGTDRGVNTAVGFAMAAPSLTRAFFNAPTAALADKYGRVPLMVIGPLAVSLSQIGTACVTTVAEVLPWRLLLGAGQSMQGTAGQMLLADLTSTSPNTRARVMGATQIAFLAGFAIGPGMGGWLAEQYGPASAFYAVAAGCATCAALNALLKETKPMPQMKITKVSSGSEGEGAATSGHADNQETDTSTTSSSSSTSDMRTASSAASSSADYRDVLSRPDVQGAALSQLAASWTMGGGFVLTPHLLSNMYEYTPGEIGITFTTQAVASLLGSLLGSYVADKHGRKTVIVPTMIIQGLATLAMASAGSDPTLFVGSMLVRSVALGSFLPANSAYAADIARTPEERGKVLSITRTSGDVGQLAGPIIAGVVADSMGAVSSLAMLGGVNIVAALAFAVRASESKLSEKQA
ncbi:MFS domain-containing protein [Pseudoscourfieldia marina]